MGKNETVGVGNRLPPLPLMSLLEKARGIIQTYKQKHNTRRQHVSSKPLRDIRGRHIVHSVSLSFDRRNDPRINTRKFGSRKESIKAGANMV